MKDNIETANIGKKPVIYIHSYTPFSVEQGTCFAKHVMIQDKKITKTEENR